MHLSARKYVVLMSKLQIIYIGQEPGSSSVTHTGSIKL